MRNATRWVVTVGALLVLAALPAVASASHWQYHETDGDACPDAASHDTNMNGRIDDFWADLDQDCRWDSRLFNSRYDETILEEARYDMDENGRPEFGLKDVNQRAGFEWFFADLDQDGRWGRWRVIPRSSLDYDRPNRMNVSSGMIHRFYQATGQSLLYGGPNPITSVYPRP
jgi:hypothetical protein